MTQSKTNRIHPNSILKQKLILASQSPRRISLLKQIGLKFIIHPSSVHEKFNSHQKPKANAERVALEKALSVSLQYSNGIVIGADTIVIIDSKVLVKPKHGKDAEKMLKTLSGREHTVITAVALVDCKTGERIVRSEQTKVKFRKIDSKEIHSYVESGAPLDKAGSYGIQDDYGAVFVERIRGCYYNVVGLPLSMFYEMLKKFCESLEEKNEDVLKVIR